MRTALAACSILSLAPQVLAHMEMNWPYAIRSKYNPANNYNDIDYSMTSPLVADGSNFPCKGYQNDRPIASVVTYTAGQTYNMTLAGSATHGGGSCQLSLSYDNGATFRVIQSMIGGCPLTSTYDFTIPSYVPAGDALFAWSWQNFEGNREYYMNCAEVTIDSAAKSRRDSASFDALPFIWKANLAGLNDCATSASENPVYPEPGPAVIYGNNMTSADPESSSPGVCDAAKPYGQTYEYLGDTVNPTTEAMGTSAATSTSAAAAASSSSSSSSSKLVTTTKVATTTTPSSSKTTSTSSKTTTTSSFSKTTTTTTTTKPLSSSKTTSKSSSSTTSLKSSSKSSSKTSSTSSKTSSKSSTTSSKTSSKSSSKTTTTLVKTTSTTKKSSSSTKSTSSSSKITLSNVNAGRVGSVLSSSSSCPPDVTLTVYASATSSTLATSVSSAAGSSTPAASSAAASSTADVNDSYVTGNLTSYLPCVPGTYLCTSNTTWVTCDQTMYSDGSTAWIYEESRGVAAGTMCIPVLSPYSAATQQYAQQADTTSGYYRDDRIGASQPDGSCTSDGSIECTNSGSQFLMCDNGGWVDMGSVASGTICENGEIVAS